MSNEYTVVTSAGNELIVKDVERIDVNTANGNVVMFDYNNRIIACFTSPQSVTKVEA